MLTVAWNFGHGKGFTYNQGLKTSGVQPLSTFVFGVLAYVGNKVGTTKENFPRIIILFSALVLFFFTLELKNILLRFFKELDKNLILFLCVLFGLLNFDLFVSFTNGLETGLYIFMVLISIRMYWQLISDGSSKNILIAGLIFGITALTRIDFLIISTVMLLLALLFSKITIKVAFGIFIIQLLIISPWFIYTYNLTGHIIQSSALSQVEYINASNALNKLYLILLAFFESITLNIFTGTHQYLLIVIGLIVLTLFSIIPLKRKKIFKNLKYHYLTVLFAFIVLMLSYAIMSGAVHFYTRYFSPLIIFPILLLIPFIHDLIKKYPFRFHLLIGLFFITIFFVQAYLYFHPGKLGVILAIRPAYINKNFEANQLVGLYSSGVTGYYCSNIINLDGKINHLALNYIRKKQLINYINSVGISGLIEWEFFFPVGNTDEFNKNWEKLSDDIGDGRTMCFKRRYPILLNIHN